MAADELLAASFPPGPVDAQQANLAETMAATASDATAFDAELGKEAAEAEAAFAKPAAMEAAEAEKTTERTAADEVSSTDAIDPQAALARLEAVKPSHYFERQALLDSVLSGAIRPLKGTYTLWLFDSGGRIQSRQATPEEAYFSAAELSRLVEALGDDWGLLFVALSYRWIVC